MASGRSTPADLLYADVPHQQYKMLGSLPVIASFCARLGIAGVIDEQAPIRDLATLTAGQRSGYCRWEAPFRSPCLTKL